jgi:hypothetical protein
MIQRQFKRDVRLTEDIEGVGIAGQVVNLTLTPADVHDPSELPEYLAGYKNAKYRADEASPPILVDKDEDKYRTFHSNNAFRRVPVKGSPTGAVPEIDIESSLTTYKVQDRFVGSFIPKNTADQADYDVMKPASERCANAIYLDREIDVWTLLTASGSWNASVVTTLAATYNWNGGSASNPISDLKKMVRDSAQPIDRFFMNQLVADDLVLNPATQTWLSNLMGSDGAKRVVGEYRDGVLDFQFPTLPMISVVNNKVLNESTSALDYTLGNYVIGVGLPPNSPPQNGERPASSYTFRRKGESGNGWEVDEYQIVGRGPKGGTLLVCSQADIAKMTGNIIGGLLGGVIQ